MRFDIAICMSNYTYSNDCSLTQNCKEWKWGCKFLATPIDHISMTDQEKAKLFIKVYREAKQKGVLECPHYRSSIIDEVLEGFSS